MQFGESGNKIGFMNTTPFGVGFPTSSTPLVGFPAVNQGLFSMTTLAGTSFQSAKVLPGPNQSSFSVFGMANSGTANIFSPNGNQFSSVGPLIVNNHHQQMFSLNNSTTNLFQWTTNEIVPCLHKPITSTSFIGGGMFLCIFWTTFVETIIENYMRIIETVIIITSITFLKSTCNCFSLLKIFGYWYNLWFL